MKTNYQTAMIQNGIATAIHTDWKQCDLTGPEFKPAAIGTANTCAGFTYDLSVSPPVRRIPAMPASLGIDNSSRVHYDIARADKRDTREITTIKACGFNTKFPRYAQGPKPAGPAEFKPATKPEFTAGVVVMVTKSAHGRVMALVSCDVNETSSLLIRLDIEGANYMALKLWQGEIIKFKTDKAKSTGAPYQYRIDRADIQT